MIELQYNKTINTKRLFEESGNDNVEEYLTHLENVSCHIQPLDDSYGQDIEGSFGKEWLMFCAVLDIQEGDLIIDDEIEYRVVSVESYEFLGQERHMELRIRRSMK